MQCSHLVCNGLDFLLTEQMEAVHLPIKHTCFLPYKLSMMTLLPSTIFFRKKEFKQG